LNNVQSRPVRRLLNPFEEFVKSESSGGVALIVAAILAFAWANSPWAPGYLVLKETYVGIGLGGWGLEKPLLLWVNDGLMVLFFFLVGLEIKREVLIGELSSPRDALLAVAAALGGMLVPAALYAAVNWGGEGIDGWGVPVATDIAFALGILALLGDRVPLTLKVFLTALAIVDDLGAVLVIALFYTGGDRSAQPKPLTWGARPGLRVWTARGTQPQGTRLLGAFRVVLYAPIWGARHRRWGIARPRHPHEAQHPS
jgi:Na+:H+ antiporter, NhaA family